jgi:diguanylate cyclase (GGDEF)-like protein
MIPRENQPEAGNRDLALLEMLSLIYEEMDLDTIEERFVDLTAEIFKFDRVALLFVKHRKGILQGKLCKGFDPGMISSLEIPILTENIFTKPLITGFPLISDKREADPLPATIGLTNFALIPIVNKKRLSCWQIKKCGQTDCPAFGQRWLRCWLVPETLCFNSSSSALNGSKMEQCRECQVFTQQDVDSVEGVLLADNSLSGMVITTECLSILAIIAHAVGVAIDNTKIYSRTLREAIQDDLTGLPNRRYFNERLLEEVDRARRYNSSFSLVFCDIDHFKQVNDTFGHPVGDRVLAQVATILRENLRSSDSVARYGGEEFALLLFNTKKEQALHLAEVLRQKIAEPLIPDLHGRRVQASFGLAVFGDDSSSFEGLIAKADQALYQAKALGRNRVCAA